MVLLVLVLATLGWFTHAPAFWGTGRRLLSFLGGEVSFAADTESGCRCRAEEVVLTILRYRWVRAPVDAADGGDTSLARREREREFCEPKAIMSAQPTQ